MIRTYTFKFTDLYFHMMEEALTRYAEQLSKEYITKRSFVDGFEKSDCYGQLIDVLSFLKFVNEVDANRNKKRFFTSEEESIEGGVIEE